MFTNLPDLNEVKAQVDRIDNTVAAIAEQVAAMKSQMDDIHMVFQGLAQVLPVGQPAGASSLLLG